ncbi:MAG: VPLPA-CTERM sorting domain-containing protein, partial [Silicimonas sp.]|nr:VPLPA-CTERM sorting domain-containing protein [Silicimonas sp.]
TTQTIEPTLTKIDGSSFNLDSFYFLNTGNGAIGEPASNFMTLTLNYAGGGSASYNFGNLQSFAEIIADGFGIEWFDGEGSDPASIDACFNDMICKNYGYTISLFGDLGENLLSAVWSSAGDANARLDDIVVSEIPLPAAGFLLLAGLGGLAMVRRRK